jgi:uncharacterized protein YlxW (UPF0749 family)
MSALEGLLNNFVVQIMIGIGMMVFLISVGESFSKGIRGRHERRNKDLERKLTSDVTKEVDKLREEMNKLRSTLVEHSMSLDTSVENLSRRVEALERRTNSAEVGHG